MDGCDTLSQFITLCCHSSSCRVAILYFVESYQRPLRCRNAKMKHWSESSETWCKIRSTLIHFDLKLSNEDAGSSAGCPNKYTTLSDPLPEKWISAFSHLFDICWCLRTHWALNASCCFKIIIQSSGLTMFSAGNTTLLQMSHYVSAQRAALLVYFIFHTWWLICSCR